MKILSKIKSHYSGFRAKTKDMNLKEFVVFIKDYYLMDFLIIAFIFGTIIAVSVTAVININTKHIITGVGVNITLSGNGEKYVIDDFYKLKNGKKRQNVEYSSVTILDKFSNDGDIESTYYTIESIVAQVDIKRLDYIIASENAFHTVGEYELYMDLNEFFTKEELNELSDILYYDSDGKTPVAIDITDTDFIKENSLTNEKKVYFAVVGNTPHKEVTHEFFYYLMKYKSK